jgi:uncharacterized protein (TIGR02246 family)
MPDKRQPTNLSACSSAVPRLPLVPQQNVGSRRRTTVPRWVCRVLALGLVVTSGSLAGCQPSGQPQRALTATVDTVAILAALDSLAGAVTRADNTGDAELFAATWAEDGAMSAPGSPPVFGRDAIVSAFRRRPALPPGGTLKVIPIEIRVLSAEWAYAFGVDTLTYVPAGVQQPVKESSTFLVLIRKTSDGWKTYREVLSSHGPPRSPQQ